MAFEQRYQPVDKEICPVCRQQFADGKRPNRAAYQVGTKMLCKTCFRNCYKNRADGQTAALLDDRTNFLTRFRPAPILEKPRFFKRNAPAGGFEYRMPYLTEQQIVQDLLLWLLLCLGMRGGLGLAGLSMSEATGRPMYVWLLDALTVLISALWAVKNLRMLGKGCLVGMGHCRRLLLLGSTAILLLMVFLILQGYKEILF